MKLILAILLLASFAGNAQKQRARYLRSTGDSLVFIGQKKLDTVYILQRSSGKNYFRAGMCFTIKVDSSRWQMINERKYYSVTLRRFQ
jgi:hypothetical protein